MAVYKGKPSRQQLEEAVRQGQQAARDPDHDPFANIPNADDADNRPLMQAGALAAHDQAQADRADPLHHYDTVIGNLAQAHYDAFVSAAPPMQAAEVFTPRTTSVTPEIHTNIGVKPSQVLGQPEPPAGLEGRARPSDYDEQDTW